jgi:hypothetical protein
MDNTDNSGFVITGEANIRMWRMLTMKHALRLECLGMKHSQGSVYALVKREFGFKGNKARVLEQLTAHIETLREVA